jgi:Zn-dependent protease with chaperone function
MSFARIDVHRAWLWRGFAIAAVVMLPAPNVLAVEGFSPCRNSFTTQQQIELGDKAKAQVYQNTPVLPDSSPATQYIAELGKRLTASAPGYQWPYNFHVANAADINAFALPGGSVFVNLGAIQAAETEAQLAGVMAHEISHVVLQHSACNAEKQQRVGILAGIGQLAAGVLLGSNAAGVVQQGIGLTAGLTFLKMSRGAEREADLEGARLAYQTGYDPRGMAQFFKIIEAKYGAGCAKFLRDHPNPGDREQYINEEIATLPPRTDLRTTTPQFTRIKTQIAGMRAYTAKEVSSGLWKQQAPNQSVGAGMNESPAVQGPVSTQQPAPPSDKNTSRWTSLRGSGYTAKYPQEWTAYGNADSKMIGPPGGIARSADGRSNNLIYGFLTDQYQPPRGLRDAVALEALVSELIDDNPGLKSGRQSKLAVNGVTARSVECDNPSANNGKGEHDWIVAFQLSDGHLRYFVFVAPSSDFERFRPTFRKIVNSIRLN